jgi:two-component system copper resistance phosphate regulon response regulator CusR
VQDRLPREAESPLRFLVIEDNERVADVVSQALVEQTYRVDVALSGFDGMTKAAQNEYDAIILDLMLPDYDGVQLCRNLRRQRIDTPVLMLTGLNATDAKVDGLDAGADDYLTKPFEIEEFIARVRAMLRRTQGGSGSNLQYADLEMDLIKRTVTRAGTPIELTAREFALLELFIRNAESVLSKRAIGEHVWAMDIDENMNVIEVYVSRLRAKVDKGFEYPLLHTQIGAGYVLSREKP